MNKFKKRAVSALVSAVSLFSVPALTVSVMPTVNATEKSSGSDWLCKLAGYDNRGYNIRGYDAQGYDKQGYDRCGNYNENEVYKPSTCTLL